MLPASNVNDQASHGRKKRRLDADLWILIGGVAGIAVIVSIASFILLRKNTKGSLQGNEGSNNSFNGESICVTIPIKEIYSATNNLSASNLIGKGIAGQRVINMDLQKPMHLSKMAKSITRAGNMIEFADPRLYGDFSFEARP
ncbi:hypothetical protein ACH5RR_030671 [Cinchona calisaya]|uniref:Uncharacterized protein n=1 Tax=Cinchona calisaya TaxID=153742 RepID=A0ABD2YYX9_9GENT